ncbi:hypothetical protein IEQ34_001432 [Dendrobium chrysotoxum]|uniref:Uncharacterized protein n=1 Tax=Dendrobium chrysotoxum TaxID=161865 RepID=A0AAV7H7S4_DENCH|nr:hypothetical protein IEQ34_001432 [Dendrobium chrysotoxum]
MAKITVRTAMQAKLLEELKGMNGEEIKGLRCHPLAHFVLPHSVIKIVEFEGHLIPKKASVNFRVMDMGWDEKLW